MIINVTIDFFNGVIESLVRFPVEMYRAIATLDWAQMGKLLLSEGGLALAAIILLLVFLFRTWGRRL